MSVTYLRRVVRYLVPYWALASTSAAVVALAGVVGLAGPWPLKILIDHVLGGQPMPQRLATILAPFGGSAFALVAVVVSAGLLITAVQNGLSVLSNYVNTRLEQRMILDFRSDLFEHAQRLSLAFHDRRRTGDFMARINFSSASVGAITVMMPPLAQSAITLVGMFWIAYHIDPSLALLSLSIVPILYYAVRYYAQHIETRVVEVRGMEGKSLSIVHEAMSMLRVIVAFGRERYEHRRFREQGETAVDARVRLTTQQTLFSLVIQTTTAAGTALVLGFGASHVLRQQLTVGELLVIMAYIAAVYEPLQAISTSFGALQEQLINLKMAMELLDIEPEVKEAENPTVIDGARGHLVFDRVSFTYQGRRNTLTDISFDAAAGQVIGIVGPTGAGKTTLIGLIPRFCDPHGGRLLLDGLDLREISLDSLRSQISIVLQEPLLFSGTIAENIRYGRLEATVDEVERAARAANAHDFISKLPLGYQTTVGERGAQLSGGERQRIAVARAFLKNAPILILDEPTSSIDSKTEAVILDALDLLMVGRTTFMIAHRLSTVRHADRILVMDHGRVVEQGAPADLLARRGLYWQLHEAQATKSGRRSHLQTAAPMESRA